MRDEICECGHAAEIHRRLIKRTWCAGSPGDNKVPGTNCYCEQYKAVTPPDPEPDTDGGDGECRLCASGSPRLRSSVSDAWIHHGPATQHILCERAETPAQEALRSLASFLGVGGYNPPFVDAEVFEKKIRDGIEMLTAPLESQLAAEVERREDADRKILTLQKNGIRLFIKKCKLENELSDVKAENEKYKAMLKETFQITFFHDELYIGQDCNGWSVFAQREGGEYGETVVGKPYETALEAFESITAQADSAA
jgi:hypothetical protein